MNQKTLEKIKNNLLERKGKIEKELGNFTNGNDQIADAKFPDFGNKDDENAAEVAAYSDSLSLEDSLQNSLRDIEKALKKVDEGEYGICKYCNKPIDAKRLLARPASSACIACKNKLSKT